MINLGEFRDSKDEMPLSKDFIKRGQLESKKMHAHIDYNIVIADLENKLKSARKADKANINAVLQIAIQQKNAGYGNN